MGKVSETKDKTCYFGEKVPPLLRRCAYSTTSSATYVREDGMRLAMRRNNSNVL